MDAETHKASLNRLARAAISGPRLDILLIDIKSIDICQCNIADGTQCR